MKVLYELLSLIWGILQQSINGLKICVSDTMAVVWSVPVQGLGLLIIKQLHSDQ